MFMGVFSYRDSYMYPLFGRVHEWVLIKVVLLFWSFVNAIFTALVWTKSGWVTEKVMSSMALYYAISVCLWYGVKWSPENIALLKHHKCFKEVKI